jgi:hypothetical protein
VQTVRENLEATRTRPPAMTIRKRGSSKGEDWHIRAKTRTKVIQYNYPTK